MITKYQRKVLEIELYRVTKEDHTKLSDDELIIKAGSVIREQGTALSSLSYAMGEINKLSS